MKNMDLVFQLIVQYSIVSFALLSIGAIAVRILTQPLERIRAIQVSLIAATIGFLLIWSGLKPSVELVILPELSLPSASEFDHPVKLPTPALRVEENSGLSRSQSVSNLNRQPVSDEPAPSELANGLASDFKNAIETQDERATVGKAQLLAEGSPGYPPPWKSVAVLAFLGVSFFQAGRLFIGLLMTRRLIKATEELSPEDESRVRVMLLELVGCPSEEEDCFVSRRANSVRFAKTSETEVPMVHGIFRPTILLPESLLETRENIVLEQSLAHEWKHIANGDLVTWQLASFCQILFWLQPSYWSLRSVLRVCQDQVADQFAVTATNEAAAYADTLVEFSKSKQLQLQGALAMAGRKSNLYQRVQLLLNDQFSVAPESRRRIVVGFAASMLAVCFVLSSLEITRAATKMQINQESPANELSDQESEQSKKYNLSVSVTDVDGQPIGEGKVTVLDWTGKFEEIGSGVTNMNGEVTVADIKFQSYPYMMVSAEGYAKTMQMLNLEAGKTTSVTIKLTRPVKSWVSIKSEDGNPVVGAELQRFYFSDVNGNQTILNPEYGEPLGFDFSPSDEQGKLEFPEVPAQSTVTAWVIHPDWKSAKLDNLKPKQGKLTDLTLSTGPKVKINFYSNDLSKDEINKLAVKIDLTPASSGSNSDKLTRHQFPITNEELILTAHPEHYNEIRIDIDGYFVTPEFRVFPNPEPRLNLVGRDESTFDVFIRKTAKAKGRVVNSDGTPRPNVWVTSSIESLYVESVEDGVVTTSSNLENKRGGAQGGGASTDADGNYEIDVAVGKCSVHVIEHGVFAKPLHTEFEVKSVDGDPTPIPEVKLYPIPILRGQVIGVDGAPAANSIVRMVSLGRGDADPVAITDESGNFELTMTRIPYNLTGGLQTDVFVVAFDPGAKYASRTAVDLTNAESAGNIKVQLEDKMPGWVLNPLADKRKETDDPEKLFGLSKEVYAQRKAQIAKLAKEFSAGLPGQSVPIMSEGTWLNSDATSLKDLRGKYVLIDFWFIGCGPCHRDMPSVQLAHQAFKESGFSVVTVHTNMQKADAVKRFVDEHEMDFPVVVDNAAGDIVKAYEALGLSGYPSYFLIDPDGKILLNDQVPDPNAKEPSIFSLRSKKIELIYKHLMNAKER